VPSAKTMDGGLRSKSSTTVRRWYSARGPPLPALRVGHLVEAGVGWDEGLHNGPARISAIV
jgi:hypothetical protein